MIRIIFSTACLLLFSSALSATEFFLSRVATPYPPGCILADVNASATLNGTRQQMVGGFVQLTEYPGLVDKEVVQIEVFRKGCTDTGRSVLFVMFEYLGQNQGFRLPKVYAQISGTNYPLRLVREPGSFEATQEDGIQRGGRHLYIVDGPTDDEVELGENVITTAMYNGDFDLVIEDSEDAANAFFINIDAYGDGFKPQRFPINGRLSGTWVAEGAVDQGFVLAFQELVNDAGISGLTFFSWYTFGLDGSTLWLTAAAFHEAGVSSVELPIELVTNGAFLGDTVADRSVVGTATLTALSCNRLQLDYDLTAMGLGSGTVFLTRISNLETAGYACRTVDTREI